MENPMSLLGPCICLGNSDTNIWFIFWSQNFNAKCNGQTGCIEIVCQNKTELLLAAYVVRKTKCINLL